MPVLAQTLLEDEHRAILHSVAPDDVTATAHRAVRIMSPPSAGNNEVIAQVPAESESGLLIAGRSTHTFEQGLEQFQQTPPLIVSVRKSTPGGKESMSLLCQGAAAKIAQLLKDYLAQGHGGTP